MPSHRLKDEQVQFLVELARGYGKILAGEAYGPEGPGLDVDLAGMEELACLTQQGLLEGLCETLTERQGRQLPDTVACPKCGAECSVEAPDERSDGESRSRRMQLRGGTFQLKEPQCYCRQCRRSFFPSTDGTAD